MKIGHSWSKREIPISFIRNNRDEKYSDLIDDLVKASYNRLTVINATNLFGKVKQREELIEELQKVVSRHLNPDSIKM